MDSNTIRVLYENVLHDDVQANRIKENEIRTAINNMKEVYKPDPTSLQSDVVQIAHYNDVAHRCAYLHKYAPLHTALVSEMLRLAMMHNAHIFQAIVNKHGCFNVCSLGGGPGNDVIAVLDVLHSVLGYFQVNATIVDIMVGWKYTFESILRELQDGDYGLLSEHVSEQYLSWSYEEANLLSKMTSGPNKAIASANLITMVKFVSASSCKDTSTMIGEIFITMQAGALVIFIDNDGGSFYRTIKKEAQFYNLEELFLLKHFNYLNETFKVKKRGLPLPCHETTVTVCLWRKPHVSVKQKPNLPTKSSEVRLVPSKTSLQIAQICSPNPISVSRTSKRKIKQKRDKSNTPWTFPTLPQRKQGYSVILPDRYPSQNSTSTSRSIFPVVETTREKNFRQSARSAGDFLANPNGSSAQSVDEGSKWRQFAKEVGKEVLWFLCKKAVCHVLLPLVDLSLSRYHPKDDVFVVAENNVVAEYFFERFPSDWN